MNQRQFLLTFTNPAQTRALNSAMRGEEAAYFRQHLADLQRKVEAMPRTYGTDGQGGAALAGLHYFTSGADWYIVELDASAQDGNGHAQAYGLADLGWGAELGYISIPELLANGAELDLHWTPQSLDAIRAKASRGAE